MAAAEEVNAPEAPPRARYSPEEVLKQLRDIPEEKRTFSSSKLLQALNCQLGTLRAMKALQQKTEGVTMADINRIILLFLKNVYNLVSGLPGALMFDALEDVVARSGILAPFVNGMTKIDETVVLELGLPSSEALCDTYEELIRVAATAIICFYHYTNYPAHPAMFPSDDATLLFTTLALRSCQDRAAAEGLAAQLAEAGAQLAGAAGGEGGEGGGGGGGGGEALITLGEIRWLMHYFRAQLSGLGGAVFLSLGDTESHKQQLVAQQADFLGLIKAVPQNPAGYSYYVRTCLQFQQLAAAGLFAAKGAMVADKHRAPFYAAQLAAQRAIALALNGGGGGRGGGASGEVSAAAKAAAAKAAAAPPPTAAAAAEPPPLVRVSELRSLVDAAREGLAAERSVLPEVYGDLLALDPVDSKLLEERLGPMLAAAPRAGGGGDGEAGEGEEVVEVLALTDVMYPTRPPAALPRGAVAVAKP